MNDVISGTMKAKKEYLFKKIIAQIIFKCHYINMFNRHIVA